MRRVAVTGLGIVAPTGTSLKQAWDNAVAGRSGIRTITRFDVEDMPVRFAGEVDALEPGSAMDAKEWNRSSWFVKLAAVAAYEAMDDAGYASASEGTTYDPAFGVSIGVGLGGLQEIEQNSHVLETKGPKRVSPFFIPYTIANMAGGVVSRRFGLQGPNICTATACASGTHGIGEAYLYIAQGLADRMIAGGAESAISPLGIAAFASMKALSNSNDNPAEASRPFDADRNGFVMGEGAGIVILEDMEKAKARGAKIYCEVVGYGLTADAHHITAPAPYGEGAQRCMKMALQSGKIPLDGVNYINAHGTSTKLNDAFETEAIARVFGDHAKAIPISSTKGVTGHCLGAAGGIEAVYTAKAIAEGIVPPTANYKTPDPECYLDYVPNEARQVKINWALSNSFGFGGTNATLAFRRFTD